MPSPKTGDIWLVRFPFTDLTTTKLRPAFVVATHGEDVIVTGISLEYPSICAKHGSLLMSTMQALRSQDLKEFGTQGRKDCSYP